MYQSTQCHTSKDRRLYTHCRENHEILTTITSIYQPTNAHIISHKAILKHFKTLRHVSILSHHHQGALSLAKVILQYSQFNSYLQTRRCGSISVNNYTIKYIVTTIVSYWHLYWLRRNIVNVVLWLYVECGRTYSKLAGSHPEGGGSTFPEFLVNSYVPVTTPSILSSYRLGYFKSYSVKHFTDAVLHTSPK